MKWERILAITLGALAGAAIITWWVKSQQANTRSASRSASSGDLGVQWIRIK
jgi:hypothetical protein